MEKRSGGVSFFWARLFIVGQALVQRPGSLLFGAWGPGGHAVVLVLLADGV